MEGGRSRKTQIMKKKFISMVLIGVMTISSLLPIVSVNAAPQEVEDARNKYAAIEAKMEKLRKKAERPYELDGATSLYPAASKAITLLKNESNEYNTSVIVMTDGDGNIGTFKDLENTYKSIGKDIPIYSITFGYANEEQLNKMANLSNGKVFDGKSNLVEAFKTVRGYN